MSGATGKIVGNTVFVPFEKNDTGNFQTYALDSEVIINALTNTVAQLRMEIDFYDPLAVGTPPPPQIHIGLGISGGNFTAPSGDWATGTLTTSAPHYRAEGDLVQFSTTGLLPAGLSGTIPYVIHAIAAPNKMVVGPASGGSSSHLTDGGSGTHSWKGHADGGIQLSYTDYDTGPTVPILVKDERGGIPDDFSLIRGMQLLLMPTDPLLEVKGQVVLSMGSAGPAMGSFLVPLEINYPAPGLVPDETPFKARAVATFALPSGAPYSDASQISIIILAAKNLTAFLNLIGR